MDPDIDAWVVTGYSEGRIVLRDNDRFCSDWRRVGETTPPALLSIQTLDPPVHTRIRHLMMEGLKAVGAAGKLEAELPGRVDTMLAGLADEPGRPVEFVGSFAEPLTLWAVTLLLGVPEPDRKWFVPLSNTIVDGMDADLRPECYEPSVAARAELSAAVADWLSRPVPGGLAAYVIERAEAEGLPLEVLWNTLRVFLQAGFQTANRFLSIGLLGLLRIPPERRGPIDDELAVNELARWMGPVHAESRGCVRDTELGGRRIRAGDVVTVLLGAANRDPAAFDAPDEPRWDRTPNLHLAFGRGPHACLGAPFAVRIARATFAAITHRHPDARLAAEPVFRPNVTERGLHGLEVSLYGPDSEGVSCMRHNH
ncbi:cytochrome P450 [Amycolatopsis azurea]|uniref:cytochrome P450 n=1 Tax=Amycolatopsis azurea TaxID=36819 RepID=UPI00382B661F